MYNIFMCLLFKPHQVHAKYSVIMLY